MRRLRIVEADPDAVCPKVLGELVTPCGANDEEVPDRRDGLRHGWEEQIADADQRLAVEPRRRTPLRVPLLEVRQLVQERDRLDRVEARRPPRNLVAVLLPLSVLAKRDDAIGELVVVCRERAGVADRAEVLAGVEAEGGREPDRKSVV